MHVDEYLVETVLSLQLLLRLPFSATELETGTPAGAVAETL